MEITILNDIVLAVGLLSGAGMSAMRRDCFE